MIKVFISHQKADSTLATNIATRLRTHHQIDSYLDVIDTSLVRGEDLASHIQSEMSKCTQLLAVVSEATRTSWWVPWEIGVASEKTYPLATYSQQSLPPEYLRKWPYLRSDYDLDRYAESSKKFDRTLLAKRVTLNEAVARSVSTKEFFADLRARLGQ